MVYKREKALILFGRKSWYTIEPFGNRVVHHLDTVLRLKIFFFGI